MIICKAASISQPTIEFCCKVAVILPALYALECDDDSFEGRTLFDNLRSEPRFKELLRRMQLD